jgi:hypothetical protein
MNGQQQQDLMPVAGSAKVVFSISFNLVQYRTVWTTPIPTPIGMIKTPKHVAVHFRPCSRQTWWLRRVASLANGFRFGRPRHVVSHGLVQDSACPHCFMVGDGVDMV